MNPNVSVCCLSVLVLLSCAGAKPVSDLQSLKQLLEEEVNTAPYFSEEAEEEEVGAGGRGRGRDGDTDKAVFGLPSWDSSDPSNSALAVKEHVLARLFQELVRTSKRSWSRNKKGGMRSCFGVRLDRIGSFSGLGC